MKIMTIAGNIGKSAETRQVGTDTVTSWTVAVEDRQGKEKRTLWFDCSLWGKRGEALAQYLTKGGKVTVSGDFSTREHDSKTYLTLRVNDVTMQGGKPEGDREPRQERQAPPAERPPIRAELDDDLPF